MRAKATIPDTVKLNTSFIKSENATAIALAAIILFALVFTIYTAIQVEYVPEWKTDAEYAHMNEVWGDMGNVKSSIDSLTVLMNYNESATDAGTSISVPLSMGGGEIPVVGTLKSGGTLAVNEMPHTVEIIFENGSLEDRYYDCGTVTFHSNNRYYVDQIFWYENGALFFEQDNNYLMKLQPSFINFMWTTANESDIYINPVELLGSPNSISGNIQGSLKLSTNDLNQTLLLPIYEKFTIIISTKYPLAWENYLGLTAKKADLSTDEYSLSSTEDSVTFTYLNAGHDRLNIHIRQATIKTEIVVGGEGSTAWEYDEENTVPPVADFTFNISEGYVPLTVKFTDHSQKANNLSWVFGDGNTSTEENPIHTFVNPGIYTVSLTANNENGTDTKTTTITVSEIPLIYPVANFTANITNGPVPLTVQFTDTSTGNPIYWEWDFGDGNTSNISNPIHTYNTTGIYNVNLTASNINGTDSEIKENYINPGVLLIGDWYPYNNGSIGVDGDILDDVEALEDYNSSIEEYFVSGGSEIDKELVDYVPVDVASNDTSKNIEGILEFNFVNFSELNDDVSEVTIVMVYRYDITGTASMPKIILTLFGEEFDMSKIGGKDEDAVWYLFRTTTQIPASTPEELNCDMTIAVDGNKFGILEIDYIGVYLSGEE